MSVRTRRSGHVTKACDPCRLRRIKCDAEIPVCSRCVSRGKECTYELQDGRRGKPRAKLNSTPSEPSDMQWVDNISPTAASPTLLKPAGSDTHLQYGPTSFWSFVPSATSSQPPDYPELGPGDWVDWAKNLPVDLKITKKIHDAALGVFAAYYAPWCMAIDMTAFLRDLDICNIVRRTPTPTCTRTSSYSPLLHNCILFLGLHLNRTAWPDLAVSMKLLMIPHCSQMLIEETEDPNLCTPRALALYASCANVRKDDAAPKTGYIHFGMAFASVQALGLNIKCDHLVDTGQITALERESRHSVYWTLYQQDLLRSVCAGRPCMLADRSTLPLPPIEPAVDDVPWISLDLRNPASGLKSMRSTVFYWSAKLACLLRKVIALQTPQNAVESDPARDQQVLRLLTCLRKWFSEQPFSIPSLHPLPHVLVMHMLYQLALIYLLRPYYRAALASDPPPSTICDGASDTIMELLKIFDDTHDLRYGVATIIPIVFATATIRLLAHASQVESTRQLDECIIFMDKIAFTWIEAQRGLEVIKFLRSEWLPRDGLNENLANVVDASPEAEFAGMLHEWLSSSGVFDMSTMSFSPFPG